MNWIKTELVSHLISNPLLIRETRRPIRLNACKTLKVSFVIGLVVSIFGIGFFLVAYYVNLVSIIAGIIAVPYCLAAISVAPLVAYTAANLTVNNMQAESFDLLQLTTLSDAHLIEGYILSTLYRCRGFFAVLIGLAPFAIIGGTYLSVYSGYIRCRQDYFSRICESPSSALIPLALMSFIVLISSLLGVYILAASLGVFFGALSKNRLVSAITAVIFSLIASCLILVILMNQDVLNTLLTALFYIPFPYFLALSVIAVSYPLARKSHK